LTYSCYTFRPRDHHYACIYKNIQRKVKFRKQAILIISFLWYYRAECKQKLEQLIKSWILFTFLCVCVCVCVMRSHKRVYSKLDNKQWIIFWSTLSAHVRTAQVSGRLLQHFITLSVSLNAMRVTLLPTVRTVHALHQLTTQQTPPSGNWKVQGSIPDLLSLPRYRSSSCSGAFELLRSDECDSVTPYVPLNSQPRFNDICILGNFTKSRQPLQFWCRSHNFNNFFTSWRVSNKNCRGI
jgi:hypothetical protein